MKEGEEEEEEDERRRRRRRRNIGYFFLVRDEISQTPLEKCTIL